jgi:uncharacterized protein YneF (UPF0154 family)
VSEKIPGGYILFARKTLESEIMDKPPLYFKLWGWMLMQAKFKPQNGLCRGQFKTSIKEMQEAMAHHVGYRKVTPTAKQIRGVYESLTKGSMIGATKVTGGLIITIFNYDKYQDPKSYEGHNEGVHEGKGKGTSYNIEEREECKNANILPIGSMSEPDVPTSVCPHEKIRLLYNKILPELPTCTVRNKTFDQHTRARWREDKNRQNLEWWENLFNDIRNSDFLMGRSKTNFRVSLDWIVKSQNMTKILNGNYKNKNDKHNGFKERVYEGTPESEISWMQD